nr:PREDICTED: neuromedin-S [Lepisosteus oculatus]
MMFHQRQVLFLAFVCCLCTLSLSSGSPPLSVACPERPALSKIPLLLKSLCGVEFENPNEGQIQDVYKRFLFHYSKSRDPSQEIQTQSHPVHPLMRLAPKLSERTKKQILHPLQVIFLNPLQERKHQPEFFLRNL